MEVYDDHMSYVNIFGKIIFKFDYREVRDVKNSKMLGAFPSMVVTLTNGQKHTFAASIGGSAISEIVSLIKGYL